MKAGTSWWYRLIADHPQVSDVSSRPKELHFFDRYAHLPLGEEDVAQYHRFFPRTEGTLVGEWTPRYMHDFWTPGLLDRAAPDAKTLVLLRDPVDRFLSGITHNLSRRAKLDIRLVNDHFHRGDYGPQLERLWTFLNVERTLVLQYERCISEPERQLARTYEFLGIDTGHRPDMLSARVNPTRFDKPQLPDTMLRNLARSYRCDFDRLARMCPDLNLALWTSTLDAAG